VRAVRVPGGDTARRLGGIEAGLPLRPVVALVFVGGLLVLRLTLLGIDDEVRRRLPLRRSLSVRASALGVGAAFAACKLPGIRASVCHDTYSAHQGVEHDDMNLLTMGSRVVGDQVAFEIVRAYVGAVFSGEERHVRRLAKVRVLEEKYSGGNSAKKEAGK